MSAGCFDCSASLSIVSAMCSNCLKQPLCFLCVEKHGAGYYCLDCFKHVPGKDPASEKTVKKAKQLASGPLADFGPCSACGRNIGKYAWDCSRCALEHICQRCKSRKALCGQCNYDPQPIKPRSDYKPKAVAGAIPVDIDDPRTDPMWKLLP